MSIYFPMFGEPFFFFSQVTTLVPCFADIIWIGNSESKILYLHRQYNVDLETTMEDYMGADTKPVTAERIIVALGDSINPKSGCKVFGCGHFHDHAAKGNQSSYLWSQCILVIGLLKKVKSRWACLPRDFRFYMMEKDIEAKSINAEKHGKTITFESKMEQTAKMLKEVQTYFQEPVLVVADSWFGNDGLWSPLVLTETKK